MMELGAVFTSGQFRTPLGAFRKTALQHSVSKGWRLSRAASFFFIVHERICCQVGLFLAIALKMPCASPIFDLLVTG
jgi:hypothetical protein